MVKLIKGEQNKETQKINTEELWEENVQIVVKILIRVIDSIKFFVW